MPTPNPVKRMLDAVAAAAQRHEKTNRPTTADAPTAFIATPPPPYRVGDRVLLEGRILNAKDSGNLVVEVATQTFTISSTDLDPVDLVRHTPAS